MIERRLLFVTGKGGVGKTTIASAIAVLAAGGGRRTLLVEVDGTGNLSDSLECGPLEFSPTLVRTGLWAMAMDTEESLKEYLRLHLRVPLLGRIGSLAHTFDFVANAAPGVREILTVGKVCWEVREHHYDLVVVDASASGHVIGQLDAPRSINGLFHVGMVRNQTRWMLDLLSDPAATGVVMVTTPEEMPVTETMELAARLRSETSVALAGIVVNRALPELFTRGEAAVFERLAGAGPLERVAEVAGDGTEQLFEAALLSTARRRVQASHLDALRAGVDPDVPMLYVPELYARLRGMRAAATIAELLAEEL